MAIASLYTGTRSRLESVFANCTTRRPSGPPTTTETTRMTDRERMEDVGFMTCMTLVLLGNYAQTGHFGGPLAYTPFNVATHLAGPEQRRAPLRLPPPQASLQRQVHARRRPLRADLLRPVDDHGRGARPPVSGDRRSPVLRRARCRDAVGRCAGIPPRRRRAEESPRRSRSGRPSAVRAGQGTRHPRARPATSSPPTSPTTSTADRRASASPRPPARPRSGTSSARRWARRRSSRSKASSPCAPATRRS